MTVDNNGALKGLKVVELGQLIAGPFCGQLLGDMGADVIKIEPPGAGDPMRQWGNGEHKVWWQVIGRNKRSVTANLRVPAGQDLVRRLLADADIMIENFKPGTVEGVSDSLGIGACIRTCPCSGWSTATIAARAAKCGSASISRPVKIRPAGTECAIISASSWSTVSVPVQALIRSSSSAWWMPRAMCVA